ncbi:MAG: helix-turn-helix transcriptional regulator [Christensenella sp.]|uniref:helix-turn-helix domain-containing protein n=1 Tax=Christensenella sp. TaxID=1935934 RepID=UPI002B203985|nr:helix-turn-helix transcriptional regulator [Christensenella sp.]MEA5002705.1 helix-turn-helix transcriptional regulator [Christensenella sp.]
MEDRYKSYFKQIGNDIRKYRKAKQWTQQELADEVGMSRGYLSQIEASTNKAMLSVYMLIAIAEALGVAPRELL